MPKKMRRLADLARHRLVSWMDANRKTITQAMIAREVGVSQSWVSLYRSGDQDADLDQLAAMASVFKHTLTELLDLQPDPTERELLEIFRQLRPEVRKVAVQALSVMLPPRGTPRGRNGGK